VRRHVFAIAFVAASVGLMVLTAVSPAAEPELVRRFGVAWGDLAGGQWWRLVTNVVVPSKSGLASANVVLPAVLIVLAERRWGPLRAAAAFFVSDWVATISTLAGLRVLGGLGHPQAMADALTRDVGWSAGMCALAAGLVMTVPDGRRRYLALAALLGCLAVELAVHRRMFDVEHLIAAVVGAALQTPGAHWGRRVPSSSTGSNQARIGMPGSSSGRPGR
jgi:phosphatidylglycerol lysyltransferase